MAVAVRVGLLGLLVGVALAGCADRWSGPLELTVARDPAAAEFGTVLVQGLPAAIEKALARLPPDEPGWTDALTIRVGSAGERPMPLAGRYHLAPDGLRFVPRFRPEGPLDYRVRLDPAALARLAGRRPPPDSAREWRVELPGSAPAAPSTQLRAIHPAAPVVPANLLRWYLEFSAPMREGQAARAVHLLDAEGREIAEVFLTVDEELWDPARQRLTLLFDMGRVKHGIRTRLERGPVLEPGRRYGLRVDAEWLDARGAPLIAGVTHWFRTGNDDLAPVEPASWTLGAPGIGSRGPLVVSFGEPLDHALAGRLLEVVGPDQRPVRGVATLAAADREWRFTPDSTWVPGRYRLRVHPALEDLAGNRVGFAFDANLRRGGQAGVDSLVAMREFEPVGE